jgi:hypothetical protein
MYIEMRCLDVRAVFNIRLFEQSILSIAWLAVMYYYCYDCMHLALFPSCTFRPVSYVTCHVALYFAYSFALHISAWPFVHTSLSVLNLLYCAWLVAKLFLINRRQTLSIVACNCMLTKVRACVCAIAYCTLLRISAESTDKQNLKAANGRPRWRHWSTV